MKDTPVGVFRPDYQVTQSLLLFTFFVFTIDSFLLYRYSAITQHNGLQVVLDGGHTHFLTHLKWLFQKFLTLKIQTNDLECIRASSADNVSMEVNAN
jgi:hypothetical protein